MVLRKHGVDRVHHYAPLHYLPFIARSRALLSKPSLKAAGFAAAHLRSMSSTQDVARGFGSYAFLTLDRRPRILKAKLTAGFPHIAVAVPSAAIEGSTFSLCRYNVAMTRRLRRGEKLGFPESETNGRYYGEQQIPVARTDDDKSAMLRFHLAADTMIEVLIHGDLSLPDDTEIVCFSERDRQASAEIISAVGNTWTVTRSNPPGPYPYNAKYIKDVEDFVAKAIADPRWRGDGLEFDRV